MAANNNTQTAEFQVEERLQSLDNADLYDLIHTLMDKKPELYQLILEWFKEKQDIGTNSDFVPLNDSLLFEYWENARRIISEFNEYGGGSEDDEYEASGYLEDISELIEEGNISAFAKIEFLDAAFKQYNYGNSGFNDELMNLFFQICKTKEEWEYLVKKLDEQPSNWRKELVIDIQKKHLHNDEAYLKVRMETLRSGLDYWDLVKFYFGKEDSLKALETAEEGILKGEGRLTELFDFLSARFAKKGDTANLERIVHTALSRQTEEKNMLDKLFEYYKSQGDYERAKENLLKSFGFIGRHGNYYAEYKRIKGFLKEPDWNSIEPEIFNKIKEKDHYDYLRICLDKDMKETVIESLLNLNTPIYKWGLLGDDEFDGLADELKSDFPEKVIEYYWKKGYRNIPGGDRKTYKVAAKNLGKVKGIYIDILNDETAWVKCFSNLKSEFKSRPAFLDEVRHL